MNLLTGERFKYGNKLFTVVNAWHTPNGDTVRYDIMDSDGNEYTRTAKLIKERFQEGLITFV